MFLTTQRVWNNFSFLETELWQRLMLSMHSLRLSQMMLIILHFVRFWRGNRTKVFTINVFFLMSWWWQIIIGSNLVETIFISIYISAAAPFREKGNRPFARNWSPCITQQGNSTHPDFTQDLFEELTVKLLYPRTLLNWFLGSS